MPYVHLLSYELQMWVVCNGQNMQKLAMDKKQYEKLREMVHMDLQSHNKYVK